MPEGQRSVTLLSMRKTADPEKLKRQRGLKADYRGATPEQVARALLRHRPEKKEAK